MIPEGPFRGESQGLIGPSSSLLKMSLEVTGGSGHVAG